MSRVPIDCPHCGKPTRVDLSVTLSTQKCDRCGVRFSAVDTGLAGSQELQLTEPPDWRRAKTGDWEETSGESNTRQPSPPPTGSRTAWIGVSLVLAVVAATALTLAHRPPPASSVKPITPPDVELLTAGTETTTPSGYPALLERIEAATVVARQYLSATTVDDLLPLIENSAALEPQIRAYYADGEGKGQLPLAEFTIAPTSHHTWAAHLQAVVISYDTPSQVARAVALRRAPDGNWRVDWPSAAAVNEVPLAKFRADRDTTHRFCRVLAKRDDYYNRAFANDRDWVCLQLVDPTLRHRFYAYARRGTQLADSILKGPFGKQGPGSPVMLRLRFPDQAPSDDQVEITEFIGPGWIESHSAPSASMIPPDPRRPKAP